MSGVFPSATAMLKMAPIAPARVNLTPFTRGFPDWIVTCVDKLDALVERAASAASAVGGKAAAIVATIRHIVQEVKEVVAALQEFFHDSEVDVAAVAHRSGLYRAAADRAGLATRAGATAAGSLARAWQGVASVQAVARITEWTSTTAASQALLGHMSTTIALAGHHFVQVRVAYFRQVDASQARITAATPSIGNSLMAGLMRLPTGGLLAGAAEAAMNFINQVRRYVDTVASEMSSLVQRIVAATKPEIEEGCRQLGILTAQGDSAARAASILTTGVDPGPALPTSSPTTVDDATALALTNALEGGWTDEQLPHGWHRVSDAELREMGIDPSLLTDPNGFHSGLFRGADGSYVMAVGGTDPRTSQDVTEDLLGAITFSHQSASMQRVVDELRGAGVLDRTEFTGHSLGGRLAAVGSVSSGQEGTTWNPAGVSDPTYAYYAGVQGTSIDEVVEGANATVHGYQTTDDILTNVQEKQPFSGLVPDPPGSMTSLPGTASNQVGGHQLDNITRGFNEVHGIDEPVELTPDGPDDN